MRGKKAKEIRRKARDGKFNYDTLKAQYLEIKRRAGVSSVSATPAAPGDTTSIKTRQKFMGFRKEFNAGPVKQIRPNRGWSERNPAGVLINPERYRAHLMEIGHGQR